MKSNKSRQKNAMKTIFLGLGGLILFNVYNDWFTAFFSLFFSNEEMVSLGLMVAPIFLIIIGGIGLYITPEEEKSSPRELDRLSPEAEKAALRRQERKVGELGNFQQKCQIIINNAKFRQDYSQIIATINSFIKQANSNYEKGYFLTWLAIFLDLNRDYSRLPDILGMAERLLEAELPVRITDRQEKYDRKWHTEINRQLFRKREVVDCLLNVYTRQLAMINMIYDGPSARNNSVRQKHENLIKLMSGPDRYELVEDESSYSRRSSKQWVSPGRYHYIAFFTGQAASGGFFARYLSAPRQTF